MFREEWLIHVVQDMYEDSDTVLRCAARRIDGFGDGDSNKKAGGQAGDIQTFTGRDQDGQD